MDKKELTKEEKKMKRGMLLIGIIAMIIPILLFAVCFTGATDKSSSNLDFSVILDIFLAFAAIPFTFITVAGQSKENTFMLFSGSLFLICFCVYSIIRLTSIPWIIVMIFVIVILIVLNINVLALETQIDEKKKEE